MEGHLVQLRGERGQYRVLGGMPEAMSESLFAEMGPLNHPRLLPLAARATHLRRVRQPHRDPPSAPPDGNEIASPQHRLKLRVRNMRRPKTLHRTYVRTSVKGSRQHRLPPTVSYANPASGMDELRTHRPGVCRLLPHRRAGARFEASPQPELVRSRHSPKSVETTALLPRVGVRRNTTASGCSGTNSEYAD